MTDGTDGPRALDARLRDLMQLMPMIATVLVDNAAVPADEALAFERQLRDRPGDVTTRLVYADWLRERGCVTREAQVRHDAAQVAAGAPTSDWVLHRHSFKRDAYARTDKMTLVYNRKCPLALVVEPGGQS